VAANGYKSTTLGSGFSYPSGVAVDGYGNLFVADNGNSAIKEIVASGGYSTVLTLSQSVGYPYFIAIQYPAVSSPLARRHRRK
jgi:DNA-binding beta-propeller fold protein YncE